MVETLSKFLNGMKVFHENKIIIKITIYFFISMKIYFKYKIYGNSHKLSQLNVNFRTIVSLL